MIRRDAWLALTLALTAVGCPRTASRDGGDVTTPDAVRDVATDAPRDVQTGCAMHAGCGVCTAVPGCGWCPSSGTCQHGTVGAPDDAACSDWDFYGARCDVDAGSLCATLHDCTTCASTAACGWCGATAQCFAGDLHGDFGGACAATWRYTRDLCVDDAATDATTDAAPDAPDAGSDAGVDGSADPDAADTDAADAERVDVAADD